MTAANHFEILSDTDELEEGAWYSPYFVDDEDDVRERLESQGRQCRVYEQRRWFQRTFGGADHGAPSCVVVPTDGRSPPWNMPVRTVRGYVLQNRGGYVLQNRDATLVAIGGVLAERVPRGRPEPGWVRAQYSSERRTEGPRSLSWTRAPGEGEGYIWFFSAPYAYMGSSHVGLAYTSPDLLVANEHGNTLYVYPQPGYSPEPRNP